VSNDTPFDYNVAAELFLAKRAKKNYWRTAAEAIRFAVENLRTPKALGAWLQVGDERFNSIEIQRLYEAADYPLRKPEWPSACGSSQRSPTAPCDTSVRCLMVGRGHRVLACSVLGAASCRYVHFWPDGRLNRKSSALCRWRLNALAQL